MPFTSFKKVKNKIKKEIKRMNTKYEYEVMKLVVTTIIIILSPLTEVHQFFKIKHFSKICTLFPHLIKK